MANKVIIGILVLLLVILGGIGYYSYNLNLQVTNLGERLTAFETEQSARITTVSSDLGKFRDETAGNINSLQTKSGQALADIGTLQDKTAAVQNNLTGLAGDISGVKSEVSGVNSAVAGLSKSVIDAGAVYQKIDLATVRITDGHNTIGSGIIFDKEGDIVTNFHVVENMSPIYVVLSDGRTLTAQSLGFSEFSDIAVLKLENKTAVEPPIWADSGQVKPGDPVVVVGSPFGLRDSLTAGVISQVNRFADIANLFQYDAAVNPGNSGGPLANARGEIIGVVVSRIPTDAGDGISYAISANKAKKVAAAIIAGGSFDYPWLGIGTLGITPQLVKDRGLETVNGVLASTVFAGGPSEAAGARANDIIVSFDNTPVRDSAEFMSFLGELKRPGDSVKLGLIRGETRMEINVVIGKRPQS